MKHLAPILIVNVIGGVAVLGSYAHGIVTHPGKTDLLWGDLPQAWRGLYVFMMFPAAVGYLVAFGFVLTAVHRGATIGQMSAATPLTATYAVFLIASTLWMPMTWYALDNGLTSMTTPIQIVLAVAGITSVALTILVATLDTPVSLVWQRAAVVGLTCLSIQCAILDALIWPRYFRVTGLLG